MPGPWEDHEACTVQQMITANGKTVAHIHALRLSQMDGVTVAWAMKNPRQSLILVRLAGIEPTTLGFGGQE